MSVSLSYCCSRFTEVESELDSCTALSEVRQLSVGEVICLLRESKGSSKLEGIHHFRMNLWVFTKSAMS